MIGTLVNGVTALLFPMFASYRALKANDISLIRPWMMYWVVFGSFQFAESFFRPLTRVIPFYGLFRMGFYLYLVLPQTQGAVQLYRGKFEPWLSQHDQKIEALVEKVITLLHNSGYARLLSLLGINVPKPPPPQGPPPTAASSLGSWASSWASRPNGGQTPHQPENLSQTVSFTDSFMSRFRVEDSLDSNLSAYLPSILKNNESTATIRNNLLGMLRSLDTPASAGGPQSRCAPNARERGPVVDSAADMSHLSTSKDADEYDFVDTPRDSAPIRETEIQHEVQEDARNAAHSEGTRRRWI